MTNLLRTAFILATAFSCTFFAPPVRAGSVNLPEHGGDTGSSFPPLDCGDDQVLVGVRVRKDFLGSTGSREYASS